MGENTSLPGRILSLTGDAADRLIRAGSGDAALLYLYLLRSGGERPTDEAARALGWERQRAADARSLLAGMGLAQAEAPAAAAAPPPPEPPAYTAADITRELENAASPFPALVGEVQRRLGKVLSTSDLKILYTIYDYTGLPAEVILLCMSWTIEEHKRKYGEGQMPRMPQVQREAVRWKEQGIDTAERADEHIRSLLRLRERTVRVLALLDIRDRRPVAKEREYIRKWTDMGFDDEALRLAYERTIMKKTQFSWPYMDGILRSWHEKGLRTRQEVEAAENLRTRRAPIPQGAGATRPQPGKAGEADQRARQDMERLRELMKREKGGS